MPRPNFNDHKIKYDQIVRVNHAGEYGAKVIYEGQLSEISDPQTYNIISKMLSQEEHHLKYFADKIGNEQVRPTALIPIWHYFGYLLGKISAKFGDKYIMHTTDAIEEVIAQHYQKQLKYLEDNNLEPILKENIQRFLAEEIEHQSIAHLHLPKAGKLETIFRFSVQTICRFAIFLSTKI